jgi:hypothetical protein
MKKILCGLLCSVAAVASAELAAMIRDGVGKYAKVVKDAGVKPE